MKCIKNRKRLLKPIKKKYRDTLIRTGILILFFGVGITALVLLRRSSQLDMTSHMVQKSVHRKPIPLPRHMQFPPEI